MNNPYKDIKTTEIAFVTGQLLGLLHGLTEKPELLSWFEARSYDTDDFNALSNQLKKLAQTFYK